MAKHINRFMMESSENPLILELNNEGFLFKDVGFLEECKLYQAIVNGITIDGILLSNLFTQQYNLAFNENLESHKQQLLELLKKKIGEEGVRYLKEYIECSPDFTLINKEHLPWELSELREYIQLQKIDLPLADTSFVPTLYKDSHRGLKLNGVPVHMLFKDKYGIDWNINNKEHYPKIDEIFKEQLKLTDLQLAHLKVHYSQRPNYIAKTPLDCILIA